MSEEYSWGGRRWAVPASTVAHTIRAIEVTEGECHPSRLVDAARPKDSPLHRLFEWDNTVAAERWRTHQARNVINNIQVQIEDVEEPVPAFVHVRRIEEEGVSQGYMNVRAAVTTHRAAVLADVRRQIEGLQKRYGQLEELEPLWDALEKI